MTISPDHSHPCSAWLGDLLGLCSGMPMCRQGKTNSGEEEILPCFNYSGHLSMLDNTQNVSVRRPVGPFTTGPITPILRQFSPWSVESPDKCLGYCSLMIYRMVVEPHSEVDPPLCGIFHKFKSCC